MKGRYYLCLWLILASFTQLVAQFSSAALQFGSHLPQSRLFNPSIIPDNKLSIGFPGLSSHFIGGSTGITLHDILDVSGPDNEFTLDQLPDLIRNNLRVEASADIEVFHLGVKMQSGYLSFDVRGRSESRVILPSNVVEWAVWGPEDGRVDNTIALDDIRAYSNSYIEYSAAYSHRVNTQIDAGIRVKYLSGILGISGEQSGYMHISSDSLSIKLSDLQYQTGGMQSLLEGDNIINTLFGGNTGFGFDFGASYQINLNMTVSAAVTDIGLIKWKTDTETFKADDLYYRFTGFELTDILFEEGDKSVFEQELDSLENILRLESTENQTFKIGLNPKFNASVSYRISDLYSVGGVFHTAFNRGKIDPLLSVNQTISLGRTLHFLTGITYTKGKIGNISAGLLLKPGPFQFHIITDRVNSFFLPARASMFNIRTGVNFIFGKGSIFSE